MEKTNMDGYSFQDTKTVTDILVLLRLTFCPSKDCWKCHDECQSSGLI